MKHEPKKHFDIHKPRPGGPDPTSKPIIVGHHPMMPDPMIREEREKTAKPIKVISDGEELPHPIVTQADKPTGEEPKPDNLPGLSDISAPHETSPALTPTSEPAPPLTSPADKSAPGAVFPPAESPSASVDGLPEPKMPEVPAAGATASPIHPTAEEPLPPTPAEPPAGQELHIPAGHAVVHHRPRIWVWGLMALIILVWVYVAVDVLSDIKLPYEFFKNTP